MPVCEQCSIQVNPPATLCSGCGRKVNIARELPTPATSDIAQADITFGYSSSANYEKAVAICQNIPTYATQGEGRSIVHSVRLPVTEIDLIIAVFDLVGSWKSSAMRINGEPASKKNLSYGALGCYQGYQKAYNGKRYCFGESEYNINLWGCKRLEMPISAWGGGWLEYGQMDSRGVWHVDKMQITAELMQRLKTLEVCPALNFQHILQTLQKIPDRIDPRIDPNWDYITHQTRDVHGNFVEIAVGVRPILKQVTGYVVGGYRPDWGGYTQPAPSRISPPPARQNPERRALSSAPQRRKTRNKGFSIGRLKIRSTTEAVIAFLILLWLVFSIIP